MTEKFEFESETAKELVEVLSHHDSHYARLERSDEWDNEKFLELAIDNLETYVKYEYD